MTNQEQGRYAALITTVPRGRAWSLRDNNLQLLQARVREVLNDLVGGDVKEAGIANYSLVVVDTKIDDGEPE